MRHVRPQVDFAFQITDYMMSLQLPPNSGTFVELIEACVRGQDVRRGLQVLSEMKTAGWSPSGATVDALAIGSARSGESLETIRQLLAMQALGNISPASCPAFHLELLSALAIAGRHSEAVELFGQMNLEKAPPDPAAVREVGRAFELHGIIKICILPLRGLWHFRRYFSTPNFEQTRPPMRHTAVSCSYWHG